MPMADFMRYYDEQHIGKEGKTLPPLYLHRRNYLVRDHPFYTHVKDYRGDQAQSDPPFDVITEIYYNTYEEAVSSIDAFYDDRNFPRILADEANFCDPEGIHYYVVEERQSALPWGS